MIDFDGDSRKIFNIPINVDIVEFINDIPTILNFVMEDNQKFTVRTDEIKQKFIEYFNNKNISCIRTVEDDCLKYIQIQICHLYNKDPEELRFLFVVDKDGIREHADLMSLMNVIRDDIKFSVMWKPKLKDMMKNRLQTLLAKTNLKLNDVSLSDDFVSGDIREIRNLIASLGGMGQQMLN